MSNRWNYNTGHFGKTIQITLYEKLNEGLGFNPNKKNSKERNSMADEVAVKKEILDVDAWMNTGGKGFFVKIEGKEYITSIDNVKALLSGEKQGIKLGLLKE